MVAGASACSDGVPPDSPPVDTPADAGPRAFPMLPAECDVLPPHISTGAIPVAESGGPKAKRIRVVGDTVYFAQTTGIHSVKVPGGAPVLAIPYPKVSPPQGGEVSLKYGDFWILDDTFIAAVEDSLYGAPLAGGTPTPLPGYAPASTSDVSGSFYARAGDNIYRTRIFASSVEGIERLPLSGAMRVEFLRFNDWDRGPLVAGADSIYYADSGERDSDSKRSIFAAPLDGSASLRLAENLSLPRLIGFDGDLYVSDRSTLNGQLFRIRSDRTIEKVSTPYYIAMSLEGGFATLHGVAYFIASAEYRLPDDRRSAIRDVVMRVHPDSAVAEVVQCLPAPPLHPTTPMQSVSASVIDLAAGDSALYVARSISDSRNRTVQNQIFEVRP
jgi:hypothetical protein